MNRIAWAFLILCCVALSAAPVAPKYHYRFDGGEIVDSVSGCNGKVVRLQQVDGLYGKALYFPAQDKNARNVACGVYIPIPADTFAKPFTLTMWLKFDKNSDYRMFKELFCIGRERGPGMRITYFYNSLGVRTGDGKKVSQVGTNSSTVLLPLEQWFQVAVVYDGTLCRIYIDAMEKASGEIKLIAGKGNCSVGTYANGYAYPMQGAADELKVYDKALTAAEIADAYMNEMK